MRRRPDVCDDGEGEAVRDGLRVVERSSQEAGSCCFCDGRRPRRVYEVVGLGFTMFVLQ